MSGKFLIVQADDFGACVAITDGIMAAFREGKVTQTSVIMPALDSERAIRLALEAGMPLGVHLALMCEWESVRWRPLTAAPSLRGPDRALLPGLAEVRSVARADDVVTELRAQVGAVRAAGATVSYVDSHIGVCDTRALATVAAEFNIASRDPVPQPARTLPLDSIWHLSLQPEATKIDDLIRRVASLSEGVHMIVSHPALDRPELRTLCSPDSRRWRWAVDVRLSDFAALRDPRFRRACEAHEVTLTSVAALGWAESEHDPLRSSAWSPDEPGVPRGRVTPTLRRAEGNHG
jgi:predicted glycoside hydrolase/deacetylase ChbG (UPF0249 family)